MSGSRKHKERYYMKTLRPFAVMLCLLMWPAVATVEAKECGDVVGGSNGVKASDALAVLRRAVGLHSEFECDYCVWLAPSSTTTTSTSVTSSTTTTSSLPSFRCPSNSPLTDLREDCSGRTYIYTSSVEVAGLITTGTDIGVLIADGSPDVLLLVGDVTGRRTFSYADVCFIDSGGNITECFAISRENGDINSTGSRLTLRIAGETFLYSFDSVFIARQKTSMADELISLRGTKKSIDGTNGHGSLMEALRRQLDFTAR